MRAARHRPAARRAIRSVEAAHPATPACRAAPPTDQPASSLVPETLTAMEQDGELQATLAALADRGQAALTREEALARQRSLDALGVPSFPRMLKVRVCGGTALPCV